MDEKSLYEIKDNLDYLINGDTKQVVKLAGTRILELLTPSFTKIEKRMQNNKLGFEARYVDQDFFKDLSRTYHTLSEIKGAYENAETELKFFDNEAQDILHALELLDDDDFNVGEYVSRLRDNRKNRRQAKDFLKVSKPFYDLMNKPNSIQFRSEINKSLNEMKELNKHLEKRTYTPRELTVLEVAFKEKVAK